MTAHYFIPEFVFFTNVSGLKKWWKMREAQKYEQPLPQWELDYKLEALPDHHMFWEYLEVGRILYHYF